MQAASCKVCVLKEVLSFFSSISATGLPAKKTQSWSQERTVREARGVVLVFTSMLRLKNLLPIHPFKTRWSNSEKTVEFKIVLISMENELRLGALELRDTGDHLPGPPVLI